MAEDAQRNLFEDKLKADESVGGERSAFLTETAYDTIVRCLSTWETFTSKDERRKEFSQCYAWKNKYILVCPANGEKYLTIVGGYVSSRAKGKDEAADGTAPVEPEQDTIVSHAGRVFDDIKAVHEAGGHSL